MRTLGVAIVIAVLIAVSCKKDPVDKYREQGVATFNKLKALSGKALPSLEGGDTLKAPEKLQEVYSGGGNTAVYAAEALATPDVELVRTSAFDTEFHLRGPSRWVYGQPVEKYTPAKTVTDDLDAMTHLKYALVVKTVEYVKPVVGDTTFTPGVYRGEAHLFDLDGKYFGGVKFAARSADTIEYYKKLNKDTKVEQSSNKNAMVEYDLKNRAWNAMRDAVLKAAPDSLLQTH